MTEKYILAIDEGTTSTRAIIFDHDGREVASLPKKNFTNIFQSLAGLNMTLIKSGWRSKQTIANAFINSGNLA